MGRNGAGKSTLLRHAAGLATPTRGRVASAGRVALLLQNPNDYLIHELVAQEAPAHALKRVGLEPAASPSAIRASSPAASASGWRWRSCSATAVAGRRRCAWTSRPEGWTAIARTTGRAAVRARCRRPGRHPRPGVRRPPSPTGSCCSPTAARSPTGPPREILTGGSYFATETARILGGWGGALTPAQGAAALQPARAAPPRGRCELAARGVRAAGVALAAGFAWYERVRPDARIVALVGTLAAFAALGRIAFAAVPNVKPTTDIVLIAGYALGGGPGFAVGALAGLSSNFFFGQGPWTPWQMAAGGPPGCSAPGWRGLACAGCCAPAGTPRRHRPAADRPLAAGDRLLRGRIRVHRRPGRRRLGHLQRSQRRATRGLCRQGPGLRRDPCRRVPGVRAGARAGADPLDPALRPAPAGDMDPTRAGRDGVAPLLAVVLVSAVVAGLRAPAPARAAGGADSSVSYLLGAENADGGFGAAPGQTSNELYTGWAALGLASAAHDPAQLDHGRLIAYVSSGSGPGLGRRLARANDPRRPRRRAVGAELLRTQPRGRAAGPAAPRRLSLRAGQPDLVRGARAAWRGGGAAGAHALLAGAPAEPRRRVQLRRPGGPVTSTTPAPRWRPSPADRLSGPPAAARSGSFAASRTATAAFPRSPGGTPTPSPRPGRSRASTPSGVTPDRFTTRGSVSPLAYLRRPDRPQRAASATRAAAPRRRCG